MQRKEHLERLIRSLVETINGTLRRSGRIRDIMEEIEGHGYEIHLSLLAGIVLHDREEEDDEDLAALFEDEEFFDGEALEELEHGEVVLTEEDRRFLQSLGLELE